MPERVTEGRPSRIAMLIDGDNAQPSLLGKIMAEAGRYGIVTIRRIYGDWTTTNMNSWKEELSVHAIQASQQFRNTIGKNATDSAMIIEAMDILHEGFVTGFCLVSSDSDYTRLATRIREKGLFVMGIGRRDTPKAFVNACEIFIFTENLSPEDAKAKPSELSKLKAAAKHNPLDPLPLLKTAFDNCEQEDGWAFLGTVGGQLRQLDPSFDSRTYGHKQLSQLIRSYPDKFEIREQKSHDGPTVIYIRPKDKAAPKQ